MDAWSGHGALAKRGISIKDANLRRFKAEIEAATDTQNLLLAESHWAKSLYAELARGFRIEFRREEGKGARDSKADVVNGFLDHGNYIAYGYAATVLNGLGISFSLPLLHGKTRRGALVFDIADLVKDSLVMPLAFMMGAERQKQKDFRNALIEACQTGETLDLLFTFVSNLTEISTEKQ